MTTEEGSTFLWTPILIILIEIILGGFILKIIFNFAQYYWKQFIASYTKKSSSNRKKKRSKKKQSSSEEDEESSSSEQDDSSSE